MKHLKLLQAALDHTQNVKGIARDRAVFDYLCGAAMAEFLLDESGVAQECPPWLWVIGVRGGDRVAEIERMLAKKEN